MNKHVSIASIPDCTKTHLIYTVNPYILPVIVRVMSLIMFPSSSVPVILARENL